MHWSLKSSFVSYRRNCKTKIHLSTYTHTHIHNPFNLVCIEMKLEVKCGGTHHLSTHPCSHSSLGNGSPWRFLVSSLQWLLPVCKCLWPVLSTAFNSQIKCFMRLNIATQIFISLPHVTTSAAVFYIKGPKWILLLIEIGYTQRA